jgi:hypothetical protein
MADMATKTSHKNTTEKKTRFFPTAVLRNGILFQDGKMLYTNGRNGWLYVSEDGETVYLYDNVADVIRELYKKGDSDDFVVTGWDMEPYRFVDVLGDAYRYYNERYD